MTTRRVSSRVKKKSTARRQTTKKAPPPAKKKPAIPDGAALSTSRAFGLPMLKTIQSLQLHTEWVSQDGTAAVKKALKGSGFELVGSLIKGPKLSGSQGYVVADDKNLVVAFRGTKTVDFDDPDTLDVEAGMDMVSNVITDAIAFQEKMDFVDPKARYAKQYRKIKIHRGFHREYGRLQDAVLKRVNAKEHRKKTVYVTGHSLGGTLALLAAFDIATRTKRTVHLYVSGCARVGGKDFRKALEKVVPNTCRLTVNKDPVPRVPPGWAYDYTHAGRLVQLYPNGVQVPLNKINGKLNIKLRSWELDLLKIKSEFKYHGRDVYKKAIDALVKKGADKTYFTTKGVSPSKAANRERATT